MRPYELNITRKRGDTKRLTFVIKSNGKPVNLSGWTNFKLGIDSRSAPNDASTNIATLTGAMSAGGADGRVYFPVPSTIVAGDYFYDAQGMDENGEIGTFVEGAYKVKEDRTKYAFA
jgi:hypothetical protein